MATRYQFICYAFMNPEVNFITANMIIIKHRQKVTSFVSKYQCGKYCLCSKYVLNQYIDNKSPLLLYQHVLQFVFHVLPMRGLFGNY